MIPVHELLSRIRWDANFARSRFVIGYWDRVAGKVLHADLREITWDADNPTFFDLMDEEGMAHSIPFHRVREVWRDGNLIWQRHPAGDLPASASACYRLSQRQRLLIAVARRTETAIKRNAFHFQQEAEMSSNLNEVVLHLDETLDDDALHRLEEAVRKDPGVVSVGHSPDKAHMIMVVYDSDSTRASNLLHNFKERGLHAQVVGL